MGPYALQGEDKFVEARKSEKLRSTVIITDRFPERRPVTVAPREGGSLDALQPGSMVRRYRILNCVGGGGMGVVYRAHDTELNRTVALKVLPPHLCENPEYLQRFRAEAQAQARLNSPYVIVLYSLMEHPAGIVLVLEYVEGQTLESRLRRQGPLAVAETIRIFEQTLRGVEHIHRLGVIHRDLKPSNLFITRDGRIKLMDFGVARLMDSQEPSQNGTMVGTLLYIPPEQINGRDTDFRSDIYTLGISLFETVTDRLPFERRTDYGLMHAHVQESPPRPKQFQRRLPPAFESIILKAIEKDPNRRFQSAAEFRAALLNLGLVERRRPSAIEKSAGSSSEATLPPPQRQPLRKNKFFSGLWLDTSLVATVAALAFTLGLYPANKIAPAENFTQAAPAPVKIVKSIPPATIAKSPLRPVAANASATRQSSKQPTVAPGKDKYESLRQAWGS